MKGDGHAGGQLFVCEKGTIPQKKVSKRDKRFTLMGLTMLTGDPVMCVLVIQGKNENALIEMGVDPFKDLHGLNENDPEFLKKNSGKNKLFPGGPTCEVNGKQVPCFVRWSESGSMTSEILAEALKTLDLLQVFPRDGATNPFLLVDGLDSRFELPILSYINNPSHQWVVCIGVPYGTSYWQVGDSKEQNGSFNIAMTKAKYKLVEQ